MKKPRGFRTLSIMLLLGIAMSGCATGANESIYTPGEAVTLQPGGQIVLPDDSRLRYVEVGADSRCPPDVQCIRAGDADVLFEFTVASGQARTLTLNTPKRPSTAVDGWRVTLMKLGFGQSPPATLRVEPTTP